MMSGGLLFCLTPNPTSAVAAPTENDKLTVEVFTLLQRWSRWTCDIGEKKRRDSVTSHALEKRH